VSEPVCLLVFVAGGWEKGFMNYGLQFAEIENGGLGKKMIVFYVTYHTIPASEKERAE
jgi:hypothetical protein